MVHLASKDLKPPEVKQTDDSVVASEGSEP
jgi:hypothetical protein